MPDDLSPFIGGIAAILSSLSYIPQLRKAWPRGATRDLALGTLVTLTTGLACWIIYGVLRGDWVIILANTVGAGLAGTVLLCKLRDALIKSS